MTRPQLEPQEAAAACRHILDLIDQTNPYHQSISNLQTLHHQPTTTSEEDSRPRQSEPFVHQTQEHHERALPHQQIVDFPHRIRPPPSSQPTYFQPLAEGVAECESGRLMPTRGGDLGVMESPTPNDDGVPPGLNETVGASPRQTVPPSAEHEVTLNSGRPLNCIRDGRHPALEDELEALITRLVGDDTRTHFRKTADMVDRIMDWYSRNTLTPMGWSDDSAKKLKKDLVGEIGSILKDEADTDTKIITIFMLDSVFGRLGWAVCLRFDTISPSDSGFCDRSRSSLGPCPNSSFIMPGQQFSRASSDARESYSQDPMSRTIDSASSDQSQVPPPNPTPSSPDRAQAGPPAAEETICPECFESFVRLPKHFDDVHFHKKYYICRVETAPGTRCGEKKIRKDGMLVHLKTCHKIHNDRSTPHEERGYLCVNTPNDFPHICHYCAEPLNSRPLFEKHMSGKCWQKQESTYICRCESRHYRAKVGDSAKAASQRKRKREDDDNSRHDKTYQSPYSRSQSSMPPPGQSSTSVTESSSNTGNHSLSQNSFALATITDSAQFGQPILKLETRTWCLILSATESGLTTVMDFIQPVRKLGQGSFGDVDEVIWKPRNATYARKIVRRTLKITTLSPEVEILKRLNHKHIVHLAASLITPDYLWLFTSPVALCDLGAYLRCNAIKTIGPSLDIMGKWETCLASVLQYVHSQNVVHGDIKPSNILVSPGLHVYLTDFGSARSDWFGEGQDVAHTPKYCAPEILNSSHRGKAADVFSLGCVWAEIETVRTSLSLQDFDTFRCAGSRDTSYQRNLGRTYQWIDFVRILQQPFLSNRGRYLSALTTCQIKDMLRFNPLQRPSADHLMAMSSCACENNISTVRQRSLPSSSAPLPQYSSNQIQENFGHSSLDGKPKTSDHCAEHQDATFHYESPHTYTVRWDLPVWAAAREAGVEAYFFSNKATEIQPFFRSSKTYFMGYGFADVLYLPSDGAELEGHDEISVIRLRSAGGHQTAYDKSKCLSKVLQQNHIPKLIGFHQQYPAGPLHGLHSLPDYLRETPPPSSQEDILKLWTSALDLMDALECLHKNNEAFEPMSPIVCSHLDLKPENIVVMSSGSKSPYGCVWKISDFGVAEINLAGLEPNTNETVLDIPSPMSPKTPQSDHCSTGYLDVDQASCRSGECCDILSLGYLYLQFAIWLSEGALDVQENSAHSPKLESQHQRGASTPSMHPKTINCEIPDKCKESKTSQELLARLEGMPEPVTKSIAKNVIGPMLQKSKNKYSLRSIRYKGKAALSDCWADYKKAMAKATIPLLSLVRPKGDGCSVSSKCATIGDTSVESTRTRGHQINTMSLVVGSRLPRDTHIESITSTKVLRPGKQLHSTIKADDATTLVTAKRLHRVTGIKRPMKPSKSKNAHKTTDHDMSAGGSKLSYSMERYLRDWSDYTLLLFVGASSEELKSAREIEKIHVKRTMDFLRVFDETF